MIDVKGLTKRFGAVTALDNISFQVESGSIFGLVGSNGAGKSTFLRTASGVYRPDAGQVLIDGGEPFENLAVKENVCFISDYPFFPRTATLLDMADLFDDSAENLVFLFQIIEFRIAIFKIQSRFLLCLKSVCFHHNIIGVGRLLKIRWLSAAR